MNHAEIAAKLIADVKELAELEGKKLDAEDIAAVAVKAVEAYAAGKDVSSKDKQAIAEAVVEQLIKDAAASSKYGPLISLLVRLFNSLFGKKWGEKTE